MRTITLNALFPQASLAGRTLTRRRYMKKWILLPLFLLICSKSSALSLSSTPPVAEAVPVQEQSLDALVVAKMSSSVFFQDVMLEYYRKATLCKQIDYFPTRNRIIKLANAIWTACEGQPTLGTWVSSTNAPGPEWRPYYMFALMMTESGCKSHNTSKPSEKTYGPWCGSVTEVRGVCYAKKMSCPRYSADIVEKLQNDLPWAALMALKAWEYYASDSKGDIMYGLMCYKYGMGKFGQIMSNNNGNIKVCAQHGYFMRKLDTVKCTIMKMGFGDPCFCFQKDNI